MKRPLKLRILAAAAAFCLIGILFYFYNAFNGNPVSAAIVTYRARTYVGEHWPEENFSVGWASYNFKINGYSCSVQSPDSPDTHFSVFCGPTGPISDSYESSVKNKGNTLIRLERALDAEVTALMKEKFPYRCQILFCFFSESIEKYEGERPELTLDMPFDLHSLPYPAALTVYVETSQETPTWEEAAEKLLLLQQIAKDHEIRIDSYTLCLEGPYEEDEKGNLINKNHDISLSVYNFPADKIDETELPRRLREFSENQKKEEK